MKKSLNIKIDEELLDKLRNIVYWTPGLTINESCEKALNEWIASIEYAEVDLSLKKRPAELKPGRRIH